jgi:hypothetical protein
VNKCCCEEVMSGTSVIMKSSVGNECCCEYDE